MPDKLNIKYIELKSGHGDSGPAWIARVVVSKSGRTFYFNGRRIKRAVKGGISGNHFDAESGAEYWISGVKKRGTNRHWAGGGIIQIEQSALEYFFEHTGTKTLHPKYFKVIPDLPLTDPAKFVETENEVLDSESQRRKQTQLSDVYANRRIGVREAYWARLEAEKPKPGTYR